MHKMQWTVETAKGTREVTQTALFILNGPDTCTLTLLVSNATIFTVNATVSESVLKYLPITPGRNFTEHSLTCHLLF